MGLLDSLLAAALQGSAGARQGAAAQANPVAGALMALLTGGGQPAGAPYGGGAAYGADQLRPPPGGKPPSMGGGMKDPLPGGGGGGMGGLGGLVSGLMGGGATSSQAAMGGGAMGGGLAGGALAAGLAALVQQFAQSGLGQQANSWVGTGANMPIDPQALTRAVGADRLSMLAQQYGIPREELAAALAEQLPQAVNELTPQGVIPEPSAMEQMLAQFLGGGGRGRFQG